MPLWKWETFLFLIRLLSVDGLFVYSLIGCLLSILLSRYVWGIGNLLSLSDWLTAIMHTDHHGADSLCRSCPLLVSVLPQQEWCSAGQQAQTPGLMAGESSCGGPVSFSLGHSPCAPLPIQMGREWGLASGLTECKPPAASRSWALMGALVLPMLVLP